jgi:hypothetical protein
MALFEYRAYVAVSGKLPALHKRFETMTLGHFKRHGIGVVGFWDVLVGTSNELHYILRFDDMAHRDKAWNAFQGDEAWLRDRAETERDGPLVAQVRNQFWKATDYSPLQ